MSPERWEEVKALVQERYPPVRHERVPLPDDLPGSIEVLEFTSPLGRLQLEWTDEPQKLGTKALGSKRIGSATTVIHEYSQSERVHHFTVRRWDEGRQAWEELRAGAGIFSA